MADLGGIGEEPLAGARHPEPECGPGPRETGAYADVAPASLTSTYSGALAPSAVAMGTTTRWALAGLSPISPRSSRPSACSTVAAQSSATAAACIDLRSGSGALV